MKFLRRFLLLLGLVALIGCDMGPVSAPPEDADEPNFELRLMLEDAADTGLLADDFSDTTYYVDQIKESDPAKGEEIEADLEALQEMSDPEEIKAKAQEILSKL